MNTQKILNKVTLNRIISGVVFLLILVGCSTTSTPKELDLIRIEEKIAKNLGYLTQCKAQGIANIFFENFEIKTNFVLRKKDTKVRIDVLSSGILGLSPTPRALILLIDDFINVFLPEEKKLILTRISPNISLINIQGLIAEYGIIENFGYYMCSPYNGVYYFFDKHYHLEIVQIKDIRIQFLKYKKHKPYIISISKNKNEIASLEVDVWEEAQVDTTKFNFDVPGDVNIEANLINLNAILEQEELNE
ncbi:MAG TPA: hypothetical protein ENG70_02250 [Candidatus Cloacimonetes bacterium]|nr:hypothetical protein [Candidatus Cloacimonadota bacterium]HEX37667.1 hypothetical protein [Candidatus Cloacimonadota bacterium]